MENPVYRHQFEHKKTEHKTSQADSTEAQQSQVEILLNLTDSTIRQAQKKENSSSLKPVSEILNTEDRIVKSEKVVVKSLPTVPCVGASKFFIQHCVLAKRA